MAQPLVNSSDTPITGSSNQAYDINSLQFPADLFDPTVASPHYVVFYISVPASSKLFNQGTQDQINNATINDTSTKMLSDSRAIGLDNRVTGLKFGALVEGGTLSGVGAGVVGKLTDTMDPAVAGVAGAALGVGSTEIALQFLSGRSANFTRPTRRLKQAIALHIPNDLSISYSMNYANESLGFIGNMAALGAANPEIASKLRDAASHLSLNPINDAAVAWGVINGVIENVGHGGTIPQSIGGLVSQAAIKNSAALGFFAGLAANPRREQLFESVNFRQFKFDYQFVPRNAAEAATILNIIHTFKYHMHPEFLDQPANFLYIYPSEFDIVYYQGTDENLALPRHTTCVLTSMDVNYTPNGKMAMLANGQPAQINVSMQFTELALLTKDSIQATESPIKRTIPATASPLKPNNTAVQ